ncbi:MAG TPA: fused isobutyryl-CoA mutase/GTPase IcmF [Acidimicrobiales bacterium]|nr:fused isobutyryl-CoA mutase/GTPase IcmF [Acidimicrobiales bacterium]
MAEPEGRLAHVEHHAAGAVAASGRLHRPAHPVRLVTAASLFDGHDAAINVMRRLLQAQGAEVIHLGHNRSVDEVARAAVEEDVQGVAISSYQGGHVEYFTYLVERLRAEGRPDVKVFGGGGGVIVDDEIAELHARGVTHIFSPADGQRLGLAPMVNTIIEACDVDLAVGPVAVDEVLAGGHRALARVITALEAGRLSSDDRADLHRAADGRPTPVLGVTGTGGSGKSSLTDELIRRFRLDHEDKLRIAVLAVDPTRRRGGGALLGDRIRMNAIDHPGIYMRSMATRGAREVPECLSDVVTACRAAGYDLVIVETPGIGQGDAAIVPLVDVALYVMTPEFGAASQLEKIDMLDFADAVAINKFDRRGAQDAFRDVKRQLQRNRSVTGGAFGASTDDDVPVFGTVAALFNDDGVTGLYQHLRGELQLHGLSGAHAGKLAPVTARVPSGTSAVVPPARARHLAEVAEAVRDYHRATAAQVEVAGRRQALGQTRALLAAADKDTTDIDGLVARADGELDATSRRLLEGWPATVEAYSGDEHVVTVRDREIHTVLHKESLAGTAVPKVALPRFAGDADLLRWLRSENLPGSFPFTGGVFAFKREGESPTRMFAGEGEAARTNRRFHLLAEGQPATRLSTAFDSVTLYGFDPGEQPDIYGKVGNSGVSIATLDDMAQLYEGFDLCDPATSVSMTINGPAPTLLAMFFNTAIDQRLRLFAAEHGRPPTDDETADLTAWVVSTVRGTVQADILKEDQGQNTCIFSTEFALRMMADIQEWFVDHQVRNFYSVSISGYHIAEAGANPVSQLAFTLANAFTYVEAYLARGMDIDDFAPNLSFFFSSGMDPEYSVLGRVARRIWAVVLRDRYGANERSQKLKYHVQTSGRSLHAQEMAFNDIRTTLQALSAIYDNCNSLHTNAFDEAVTTPTAASVRRAMAIQLIVDNEWGVAFNQNPNQGSFIVEQLTELVEAAVLDEFDRLAERGGVLGAMETGYQRGRIQDESMLYEQRKHDGSLPIVGVNTFLPPAAANGAGAPTDRMELARSTDDEKQRCLDRCHDFQGRHAAERPAMLDRLRRAALSGDNLFGVLMDAVRCCTLGEITHTLFEVGGRYRRSV